MLQTVTVRRGVDVTSFGPATGHWRLVNTTVLPHPASRTTDEVDVLCLWEPVLLNDEQEASWRAGADPADHIRTLGLDDQTVATLESAGLTSVHALKAMPGDQMRRIRLLGPMNVSDLLAALGR